MALVSFDEDAFVRESREDGATDDDEPWEDLGMDLDAEVIDADGSVIFFLAGSEDMIEEVASFEEAMGRILVMSSSGVMVESLRLPADTEVNVEVSPTSSMSIGLVMVSTPLAVSSVPSSRMESRSSV